MIFDGVARFIVKHHKVVVVAWLVALVVCVPLFSRASGVVSSKSSLGSATGESAAAQNIINSKFGSASGASLFLVISAANVTTPAVHSFVDAFSNASLGDPALSNLTSVSTVYHSVSNVVSGAVGAERSFGSGASSLTQLFYGVPVAFVNVWNQSFALDPTRISQAEAATSALLASSVKNQTELFAAQQYLQEFALTLTTSYKIAPQLPMELRIRASANATATLFISSALPASQRTFASDVLRGFSLSNYTAPSAMEAFVVHETAKLTLYTPTFAGSVYPIAFNNANESAIISSIIANPSSYHIPPVYRNSVSGYVSPDHKLQLVVLNFKEATNGDVTALRSLVKSEVPKFGLDGAVAVTGGQALSNDFTQSSLGDVSVILPIAIIILIAATGIFFRSAVTPGVSLLAIGVALGIADSSIIYLIGTYVVSIDANVPSILLTVIIGVGTDYSVFLLARYREERVKGRDKLEAVASSVTWAGESIATSGLTVIISFLFLGVVVSVDLLRGIGLVVGAGVLVALVGSLTLVPSLMMSIPDAVFWPNAGKRFARYAESVERSIERKTGYFSRSAGFSIKHAKVVVILALVATGPALYVWYHSPVGYDLLSAAPKDLESVSSFNSISDSFGAGKLFPTYVVMVFKSPLWNGSGYNTNEMRTVDSLTNLTLTVSNVKSVTGPTRPAAERVDFYHLGSDPRSKLLEGSINGMISKDGLDALLNINLVASPQNSTSLDTVQQLRTMYQSAVTNSSGSLSAVYVGGSAGSTLDSRNSVNSQFDQVIVYVMLGVAAVLLLVLGSLFLPLFAIASIVMSIAWTLAATAIVFQHFYNFPLLFITPLTLFVLLLGLGMDYNVFILTRIREEASKGAPLKEAITTAIERTGGIITAAALILAGSLGALMLSSNLLLKEFGFAFFYSILIDALITRTYIVPSVMSLMGRWNWYAPGKLQRVRMANAEKRS
ncbi:MAG: MMPL family transporter [Nitrososphaerales archaeon]|nr:MMPL family transporter [Nitrososphaerales archaeon]